MSDMVIAGHKKRLLIITTDYFHLVRYRLHDMLPWLRKDFEIKVVAIAPLTYDLQLAGMVRGARASLRGISLALRSLPYLLSRIVEHKDEGLVVIRMPFPHVGYGWLWLYLVLTAVIPAFLIKINKIYQKFDACLASSNLAGFCALLVRMPFPIIYEDVDRCEYLCKGFLARKTSGFLERYCIRKSDQVISAGYTLAESAARLRGMGVQCVPNGVDPRIFKSSLDEMSEMHKDRCSLVYSGSIEEWSGLDVVVRALPLISSEFPGIRLIMTGSGTYLGQLAKLARELGVDSRVAFLGHVQYEKLPSILSNSDVGLVVDRDEEFRRYAFSHKLLDYMAAGLPVIATDVGDAARIVESSQCGLIVGYSPEAVSNAIKSLLSNRDLMETYSRNARNFVKKFDLKYLAQDETRTILKTIDVYQSMHQ